MSRKLSKHKPGFRQSRFEGSAGILTFNKPCYCNFAGGHLWRMWEPLSCLVKFFLPLTPMHRAEWSYQRYFTWSHVCNVLTASFAVSTAVSEASPALSPQCRHESAVSNQCEHLLRLPQILSFTQVSAISHFPPLESGSIDIACQDTFGNWYNLKCGQPATHHMRFLIFVGMLPDRLSPIKPAYCSWVHHARSFGLKNNQTLLE